ncbi:hypothetical protein AB0M95_35000 [Sphaerisporangium sp. NPDC051017]
MNSTPGQRSPSPQKCAAIAPVTKAPDQVAITPANPTPLISGDSRW